jgi:hypothetical protein
MLLIIYISRNLREVGKMKGNIIKINQGNLFKDLEKSIITGGKATDLFCGSGYLETVENLGLYRQPEEKHEPDEKEKLILKYDNSILTPLIPIIEIEPDRVKRC